VGFTSNRLVSIEQFHFKKTIDCSKIQPPCTVKIRKPRSKSLTSNGSKNHSNEKLTFDYSSSSKKTTPSEFDKRPPQPILQNSCQHIIKPTTKNSKRNGENTCQS